MSLLFAHAFACCGSFKFLFFAASFGSAAAVCQAGMTGQFCNKCKYNLVFKEFVCCLRPVAAVYQW